MGSITDVTSLLRDAYTDRALAKELRVSLKTLANWRSRKQGPAFLKIGRRILYTRDAVRVWLIAQRREAA